MAFASFFFGAVSLAETGLFIKPLWSGKADKERGVVLVESNRKIMRELAVFHKREPLFSYKK
jgi:hypothetical protein